MRRANLGESIKSQKVVKFAVIVSGCGRAKNYFSAAKFYFNGVKSFLKFITKFQAGFFYGITNLKFTQKLLVYWFLV